MGNLGMILNGDEHYDDIDYNAMAEAEIEQEYEAILDYLTGSFTYYTDPGHGWLKVHRWILKSLGIAKDITEFSYESGDVVYLEEDQDATAFFNSAKTFLITNVTDRIEWNITERHTDEPSFIRDLPSYSYNKEPNDLPY